MGTVASARRLQGSDVADNLGQTTAFGPLQGTGRQLSISASWTGTPTGTFSLQYSMDGGATWSAVPGANAEFTAAGNAQPAGSASSALWTWENVPGASMRVLYTRASGTGTLTIRATQQGGD